MPAFTKSATTQVTMIGLILLILGTALPGGVDLGLRACHAMSVCDGAIVGSVAAHFGRLDCGDDPSCAVDMDNDGDVDGKDLAVASAGLGAECSVRTVGPEGGTLDFPNGVRLDFPPGAVGQTIFIVITDLACEQMDPILRAPVLSSHEKRCLGGFSAKPEGLTFNLPVTATVPVSVLEPGEIPVWVELDLDNQQSRFVHTELLFRGEEAVLEVTLRHFSDQGAAAIRGKAEEVGETDQLVAQCSEIPTPACCRTFHVKSSAGDVASSDCDCQIVGEEIKVTFIDCPGSPSQTILETESSGECPTDLEGQLVPADPHIWECQTLPLTARLMGTNQDGSKCDLPSPVSWEITENPGIVNITETGPNTAAVKGLAEGATRILAKSVFGAGFSREALVTVETLTGPWRVEEVGEQTCTGGGETWTEDDAVTWNADIEQNCESISATPNDIPGVDTYRGNLVETGNPEEPFSFSLSLPLSSNSADCRIFFASNGTDMGFGDPFCPPNDPNVSCAPVSCQESEDANGIVKSVDSGLMRGKNRWHFTATVDVTVRDPETGETETFRESVSCDGSSTVVGTKL